MIYIFIIAFQLILFLVLFIMMLYFLSMLISDFFGVPFVPTRQKSLTDIFSQVRIRQTDRFYDLGCGDGRLVFHVNKAYGARGVGIELNPLLNWFSNLKKRLLKYNQVNFVKESLFDTDLRPATVIYLFLFPEVVEKLVPKLLKECRKGTLIISHGFKAKLLEDKKVGELKGKPFVTYYYRL